MARYFRILLARLRPDVQLLGALPGAWTEDLAMTGAGDALITISLQPRPKLLRPLIDYARTTRMGIVAIVDPGSVAWARRVASVAFFCHGAGLHSGSSAASVLSTFHLIVSALASRLGRSATQRAELLAEIHDELDDED